MTKGTDSCEGIGHDWRIMDWQEAYPASSGRVCRRCDRCELGWLGTDVNAAPQEPVRDENSSPEPL
jgi:hypothetical protein